MGPSSTSLSWGLCKSLSLPVGGALSPRTGWLTSDTGRDDIACGTRTFSHLPPCSPALGWAMRLVSCWDLLPLSLLPVSHCVMSRCQCRAGRGDRFPFGERAGEEALCWRPEGSRGVVGCATLGAGSLMAAHHGNRLIQRRWLRVSENASGLSLLGLRWHKPTHHVGDGPGTALERLEV